MIKTLLFLILLILMVMFDNNFFNFNVEPFSKKHNIDVYNKKTLWIYTPKNIKSKSLIKLLLENITNKLGDIYNILIFDESKIKGIIPEYMDYVNSSKNTYVFFNMLKYFIIYKHGGIWMPYNTLVLNKFYIEDTPYNNDKLIFFGGKTKKYNAYHNKFNFEMIASKPETKQVKRIIDKLINQVGSFNNNMVFNNLLDFEINTDSHIHYSPIIYELTLENLTNTFNKPKIKSYQKLVILDKEELLYSPQYKYLLNLNKNTLKISSIFLKELL